MKDWLFTLIVGIIGGGIFVWLFGVNSHALIPVGFVFVYATLAGLLQHKLVENGFLAE